MTNFICDLHIHSRFSRATSKQIDVPNLEKWAKIKGIDLLGSSDFTHPKWLEELKQNLEQEDETGIYRTSTGFPFLLSTELSLMYSQGGKGRKIHHVIFAPSFEVVDQINEELDKWGRRDYDGRPIFGKSSIEFVDMLMNISKDIEVIPAHAWTPYFGVFGSMSGFDSLEECFGDRTKYIHAIETGLSSDPPMNWKLSALDDINLVSFSDAHSFWPWRLGRECTVFDLKNITYNGIVAAIRREGGKAIHSTIEYPPEQGKYHWDGHRKCGVSFSPEETREHKGICPVCNRSLTLGVEYQVEQLADRQDGFVPPNAPPFRQLIPLSELIAAVFGMGIATKAVWAEYNKLVQGSTEFSVLMELPRKELESRTHVRIADAIIKSREGAINVKPGYDGVYGEPEIAPMQKTLGAWS